MEEMNIIVFNLNKEKTANYLWCTKKKAKGRNSDKFQKSMR